MNADRTLLISNGPRRPAFAAKRKTKYGSTYQLRHAGRHVLSADATVCPGQNNGTLSLSGYNGDIQYWEKSDDNGISWQRISHTKDNYSFANLDKDTYFRVRVKNGACASTYSSAARITVLEVPDNLNAGSDRTDMRRVN